ncbi:hypothetical protein [Sporocytophaga myxococcoides]|uniref:hypothetical protein n=1 Tax=Sporocytophaga myxococcoides TaxID=153721 RepID=UPI0004014611|nr:hypothetical protein [Sporocytophaga myxococcoides]
MKKTILTLLVIILIFNYAKSQNRPDNLLVFIGEKIEVKYSPEEEKLNVDTLIKGIDTIFSRHISMDNMYIAKYKILRLVHGNFKRDTIEFTVFDHYGFPRFSKYQTVLLFVSYNDGKLYHEKYQYYDLYLTPSGKWASPYSTNDYNHAYKDSITVKPEKIQFKNEVSFPVSNLSNNEIKRWYPKPYFEIKNDRAIAVYGNYVEDLFKLKQQTILKARGIY